MDVNDINLDAVLRAPDWAKAVALLAITALLAGGFWYFVYQPHTQRVAQMDNRVQSLKAQYQRKKSQVANLPALREHFQKLQERMEGALEQLPDRTEVPELIDDVDRVGRAEGLQFQLFEPKTEKQKEFYAVKPVALEVQGSFNAMGRFLAATASLPRIVNVGDLSLQGSGGDLTLKATARTFRYLSDAEQQGGGK
ncbi:type 4a pilus biogenesis protein PilO [Thiohalorhabdus sp.]|uniref:type 4a pilus biogenesis protein PilO n=1 Tax=Thiohalorhabdus sp. TaxID=3094134 RepID=UPI002FC3D513